MKLKSGRAIRGLFRYEEFKLLMVLSILHRQQLDYGDFQDFEVKHKLVFEDTAFFINLLLSDFAFHQRHLFFVALPLWVL